MSTAGFSARVEGQIIARDQGKCARCRQQVAHLERGTGFGFSIHHRRPRSKGGTVLGWVNAAANGVVLCEHCHRYVHAHPGESYEKGFLVRANRIQKADEVSIVHAVLGPVLLGDDGSWRPVDEGPTPESMRKDVA